jgi:hypothetical protein
MRLAPVFTHNIHPTPEKKMDNILFTHHRDMCSVAPLSLSLSACKRKDSRKIPSNLITFSPFEKERIKDDILE